MASEENAALIASMREAPPLTGTTPAEWRKEFDTNFADFPFPASVTRERVALNNDVDGEWFRHGDRNDGAARRDGVTNCGKRHLAKFHRR
jgi:hypothetical protein